MDVDQGRDIPVTIIKEQPELVVEGAISHNNDTTFPAPDEESEEQATIATVEMIQAQQVALKEDTDNLTTETTQPVTGTTPFVEPTPEPSPEPTPAPLPTPTELAQTSCPPVASAILDLTNQIRKDAGLPPLGSSSSLDQAAMQRAAELITCSTHIRPDGRSFFTILTDYGITAMTCAENFAMATEGAYSVADIVNLWMASSSHKANILGASYSQIGVGYAVSGDTAYYVQIFVG